jgi:VanZ family protein
MKKEADRRNQRGNACPKRSESARIAAMFDRPPSREWLSWLLVAAWSLVIFATIPLARAIQRSVREAFGEEAFLYAVLVAILAAFLATLRHLRALGRISPARGAWLVGVAAVYAGYAFTLRRAPVEAVHFLQYGVLGVLAFRALTHRMRDPGIYLAAALVGGIVGILDEAIQWLTPQRVWDLRDVWFNFFAASLIQLAIAAGIRPRLIAGTPTPRSVRLICRIAALATLLLTASLLNTPPRIAWYAERVPALGFLLERSDLMLEYGHLYEVPEIGRFRSRFSPAELERIDARRSAEAGRILAGSSDDDYQSFLERYTPISDPFLHEARVHLFRRDRYLITAERHLEDERWYRSDLTVGYRENRILERYFTETLRHSGRNLSPERRAHLAQQQYPEQSYESRVSEDLWTRIGERHVVAGSAATLLVLLGIHGAAGRRMRR